jgi:hypothetical protein
MNELPQACQFSEAVAGDAVAIDVEGCRVALGPHAERPEVDRCLIAAAGPDGDEAIAVQCLTTYVVCSNNAISAESQTATFAANATASALGYLNATSTPAAVNASSSSSFAPLRDFANATSTVLAASNATGTALSASSQLNASLPTTTSAFALLTASALPQTTTTSALLQPIDPPTRRQAEVFECVPELPPICAGLAGKDATTVAKYIPQCALALDQAANHPDASACLYGVESTSGSLTGDAFVACLDDAIVCEVE